MRILSFRCIALVAAIAIPLATRADDTPRGPVDVISLDATVTSEVVPDLAIVTLAIVREGPDVAPLTNDVNQTLAKAFADVKAVPGVVASNAGYSTQPRFNPPGVRNGWTVRAQIVLKSKDFAALGALVGKLGQTLQIVGSSYEVSPDLRAREGNALIERAAHAFQDKATATAKAFGYSGYALREATIGAAGQSFSPRTFNRVDAMAVAAPAVAMPLESGPITLSLTVNGSVQMHR